jgi:hypothetical protein
LALVFFVVAKTPATDPEEWPPLTPEPEPEPEPELELELVLVLVLVLELELVG